MVLVPVHVGLVEINQRVRLSQMFPAAGGAICGHPGLGAHVNLPRDVSLGPGERRAEPAAAFAGFELDGGEVDVHVAHEVGDGEVFRVGRGQDATVQDPHLALDDGEEQAGQGVGLDRDGAGRAGLALEQAEVVVDGGAERVLAVGKVGSADAVHAAEGKHAEFLQRLAPERRERRPLKEESQGPEADLVGAGQTPALPVGGEVARPVLPENVRVVHGVQRQLDKVPNPFGVPVDAARFLRVIVVLVVAVPGKHHVVGGNVWYPLSRSNRADARLDGLADGRHLPLIAIPRNVLDLDSV